MEKMKEVVLLSLFGGIDGFALGFVEAGYTLKTHYYSEIDKHASANCKYNFKNSIHLGSVKNVRHIIRTIIAGTKPGDKLIITFGSPCQDFSLAGKGEGLTGSKSSLIKFAIFLIKWLRPDVYIWENVKGAYSTNDGADYWAIIKAFANIPGYRCEQQLLNTAWFLPQNRERIYFIGHLTGRSEPGVFPFGKELARTYEGATKATNIGTLTAGGHSGGLHSSMCLIKEVNPINSYAISATYSKGKYGKSRGTLVDQSINAHVSVISRPNHGRTAGREYSGSCPTLQSNMGTAGDNVPYVNNIRRLTEIECERLQGFPDDWTRYGDYNGVVKEIPKTQRYKMCGNAVTVNVVKEIAQKLTIF